MCTLPYMVLNLDANSMRWALLLLVIIAIMASSSDPKPLNAAFSAFESSSALKLGSGRIVGWKRKFSMKTHSESNMHAQIDLRSFPFCVCLAVVSISVFVWFYCAKLEANDPSRLPTRSARGFDLVLAFRKLPAAGACARPHVLYL